MNPLRSLIAGLLRLFFWSMVLVVGGCTILGSCDPNPTATAPRPTASPQSPNRVLPEVHAKYNRNFAFMTDSSGALWDPCLTITYVVNPASQPKGGLKSLQRAAKTVEKASGLRIVYGGTTRENYTGDRHGSQPSTYPGRWAPVLITWESDKVFNRHVRSSGAGHGSVSDTIGLGGPIWAAARIDEFDTGPRAYFVSGEVALRAFSMRRMLARGNSAEVTAVAIHEWGHVLGLDHVASRTQVMNSTATRTRFGAGDKYGFALAGSGACAPINQRPQP